MIYITGDTHGDFTRIDFFCKKMNTTKQDIIIILGDAGINYYLNEKDEKIKRHISNFCEMSFLVKMILCNLDFHRFPRN